MSLANYTDLKATIAQRLSRRTDLTDYIPDYIALGEMRIYRDLRIAAMEVAISTAISSGTIATPTRYRELKFAYIDGTPVRKLERKDSEWIYHNYPTRSADSKPIYIARQGETFIFGPYPDSAYTVKGIAYCGLAALSADNLTNWFTTNAMDLLLYASLVEAAIDTQDDQRLGLWEGKYELTKTRIQRENDNEEFSGSPLSATVR